LASSRQSSEELSEANSAAGRRAERLGQESEAFAAACGQLRSELEASQAEASRRRSLAAGAEQSAAFERSAKGRAEARNEHLEAELAAAQCRLANRGTHVELLIRERERLWAQLERSRRRGGAEEPK
ncbi:unnamed protein product, partial [Polarella glacialis]